MPYSYKARYEYTRKEIIRDESQTYITTVKGGSRVVIWAALNGERVQGTLAPSSNPDEGVGSLRPG